ncbi:Cupin domain-containing protein [Streptoalloteichus tenebrarius]|uniref:Cupin domain-containing protein n=1 Tax=Streptoalloteichus tenebrarius (strain ATCC 17920 / DSM 40477 / JCM 4838 / CBS 697.72 / NBRC 16177 / NCIMB 11028 / NRRL B-12390 / A12253. 1 / ISP 5477) TaxID=1933 RepID=A0ABT1HYZ2_STRSD|nr:XRE family transcriptional regulator [Streptoalloteichus tenebrarius]MCP2260716.1 Cupin domain-containing protein [Streptoalloteichus tenebrarius]BFF03750.1 XRE family transcriptional regulator [Streptoalloteichus tenebrarius]
MGEPLDQASDDLGDLDDLAIALGRQLHEARAARGWTLEELAARTELSVPYLSRLESGRRQPSLAVLVTLARSLGVPVSTLLDPPPDPDEETIRVHSGQEQVVDGLRAASMTRGTNPDWQVWRVAVPAGRPPSRPRSHDGVEWIYVLDGALALTVGSRRIELSPGEAAEFDARQPHRLAAAHGDTAHVLLSVSHPHARRTACVD